MHYVFLNKKNNLHHMWLWDWLISYCTQKPEENLSLLPRLFGIELHCHCQSSFLDSILALFAVLAVVSHRIVIANKTITVCYKVIKFVISFGKKCHLFKFCMNAS